MNKNNLSSACVAFETRFKTLSQEDKMKVSENLHKKNISHYRDEHFGLRK